MEFNTPTPRVFENVKLTRENIKAGLVIRSPASDGSVHVFNDTVIESIQGEIVHLCRPYCYMKNGVVHTDCERHQVPMSIVLHNANYHLVMEGSQPARVWER